MDQGTEKMMLVILLVAGTIVGYVLSRAGYNDVIVKADKIMSLSVYAIVFSIGLEASKLFSEAGTTMAQLLRDSLIFLFLPVMSSLVLALVLHRVGLLCS